MSNSLVRTHRRLALGALGVVGASALVPLTPAGAEADGSGSDPLSAGEARLALAEAARLFPVEAGTSPDVALPVSSDDPATIELGSGAHLAIAMPLDGDAPMIDGHSGAARLAGDSESDTWVSAEPLASGGVRMMVALGSSESPEEHRFDLTLPTGSTMTLDAMGGAVLVDAAGDDLGYISAPWAVDADGRSVPTRYSIEGTTLVQHVAHRGAAYPVVADPSIQGDCGIVTCTIRLNRRTTRTARDVSSYGSLAASMCAVTGPVAPVCAVAVGAAAISLSVYARRVYEEGDCLKVKVWRTGGSPAPGRVAFGDYNCTDK